MSPPSSTSPSRRGSECCTCASATTRCHALPSCTEFLWRPLPALRYLIINPLITTPSRWCGCRTRSSGSRQRRASIGSRATSRPSPSATRRASITAATSANTPQDYHRTITGLSPLIHRAGSAGARACGAQGALQGLRGADGTRVGRAFIRGSRL